MAMTLATSYNPTPAMRGALRLLIIFLIVTLIVPVLGLQQAAAQEEGSGPIIQGTLNAQDAEGERNPVEGVRVVVADESGAEVAEGVSAADGTFAIEVPAPGNYTATIDVGSLPEGISLRDSENTTRAVTNVLEGGARNVLFALQTSDAADAPAASGGSRWARAARLSVEGLLLGIILAMSAIGLSLIYGTTKLVNFAHGELVTFGAVLAWAFNVGLGLHLLIAAPLAVVGAFLVGGALDVGFWRPLRRRGTGITAMMIISIGLGLTTRYLLLYFFGDRSRAYDDYAVQIPGSGWDLNLGFTTLVPKDWIIILLGSVTLIGVALGLKLTRWGKAMRAVSDNPDLAASSGIDVERVATAVWAVGAGLATMGGIFLGLTQLVRWDAGFFLLLLMFAGVTLGGLGEAFGPMIGCIIIGVMINVITALGAQEGWRQFFEPELKNTWALWVLIIILLIRPQGLFGRAERIG